MRLFALVTMKMPATVALLTCCLLGGAVRVSSVHVHGFESGPGDEPPSLPTEGAWSYEQTIWLAKEQLGRCIHPELTSDKLTWLPELQAAVKAVRAGNGSLEAWGKSYSRELNLAPGGFQVGSYVPSHRAVGLTSDRNTVVPENMFYPESKCQEFDYDADPATVKDPHGCGLFRESFSRLQALKKCVVKSLDGSAVWKRYRTAATAIRNARKQGSRETDNPDIVTEKDIYALVDAAKVSDDLNMDDFEDCSLNGDCVLMDANARVDEMIKYLSFKEWDWTLDAKKLKKWVASKVRYTASVYKKSEDKKVVKKLGMEDETIDEIVSTCFQVRDEGDQPKETKVLQRSLACNSLMYDQVEVPGAPQPPPVNAANMWDESLRDQGKDTKSLTSTPPVCSRAAAALSIWPQIHAKGGYSIFNCMLGDSMRWSSCAKATSFNCICLEKCWRSALKRVCELTPGDVANGCCGDWDQL